MIKKIIILILIISMISGCSSQSSQKYENTDFGIYDTKSQTLLKLGDDRKTIEKYIGNAEKEESSVLNTVYCHYGDLVYSSVSISDDRELEIEYNDDGIAICFLLKACWNEDNNRFELPSGVKVGSKVIEFQEAYPQYFEIKNDGLQSYSSELHVKKNKDFFEVGNFTEEDYSLFKRTQTDEALKKDKSIGINVDKANDLYFQIDEQWAYVTSRYDDYTEIEEIEVGYGWNQ